MEQKLIIIRGAPASGKSTIAKKFRNFEKKFTWLKVDAFKDFFAEDSSIALDYVNGSANATLEYLLDQNFSVVMEGIFQDPSAIEKATDIANKRNIHCRVFGIDIPLNVLQARDKIREGVPEGLRSPLGNEAIERLYNIIKDNPYEGAIKLDTDKNTIEECTEIIKKSFDSPNLGTVLKFPIPTTQTKHF